MTSWRRANSGWFAVDAAATPCATRAATSHAATAISVPETYARVPLLFSHQSNESSPLARYRATLAKAAAPGSRIAVAVRAQP
jgi:hypothetical protein